MISICFIACSIDGRLFGALYKQSSNKSIRGETFLTEEINS